MTERERGKGLDCRMIVLNLLPRGRYLNNDWRAYVVLMATLYIVRRYWGRL